MLKRRLIVLALAILVAVGAVGTAEVGPQPAVRSEALFPQCDWGRSDC